MALGISAGTLFGLSKANEAMIQKQGEVPIYFSILMTFFTYFFNHIIGMILVSATKRQNLDNKTEQSIEEMHKIIIYQSINLGLFSLFMPFLVKLPNIREGVKSLSLPYVVVISALTQAFMGPTTSFIMTYFGFYPRIWKFLQRHNFLHLNQR